MKKQMPNLTHLITPDLRKTLSNLGILSARPKSKHHTAGILPNGLGRLEFDTFIEMQKCINSLYANCSADSVYFDETANMWVLFVKWEKAV